MELKIIIIIIIIIVVVVVVVVGIVQLFLFPLVLPCHFKHHYVPGD